MSPSSSLLRMTLVLLSLPSLLHSFSPRLLLHSATSTTSLLSSTTSVEELITTDKTPTDEWELDCYSRPVLVNGKKLWEVLITDSNGSFRYLKALPSNQVNSREVRKVVEQVIDQADVKPSTIRFFRGAMFNMVCCACEISYQLSTILNSLTFLFRSILLYQSWKWWHVRHGAPFHWPSGWKNGIAASIPKWRGTCSCSVCSILLFNHLTNSLVSVISPQWWVARDLPLWTFGLP